MIESPNQQRRFSDKADNETTAFSHDMSGSIKRMLDLLSQGKSLEEAKELIGHREGVDYEGKCLADFAETLLTTSILEEGSIRVSRYDASEKHAQSFKLNTEVIRLSLVDALQGTQLAKTLNEMDFHTFGVLITEIYRNRQAVMDKYRKELEEK